MQVLLGQISQYVSVIYNAVSLFVTLGSLALTVGLFILAKSRVLPRLYKELGSQNSTKTMAELKWIKEKYVEHRLSGFYDTHSLSEISASEILKEIRRKNDYVVGIVGKAGLGKSHMLLWLYLKLSKSLHRRCAFIQIGAFSSKESVCASIKKQLNTVKRFVPICKAYIFIDAVDEAFSLFNDQISFDANFINGLKNDIDILSCNIIFSIRSECFQQGMDDIAENTRTNRNSSTLFKIATMKQNQIINIFKSFKYAKRMEKRLAKKTRFNYRFQDVLPKTKVRKAISLFEQYIKKHPDTIFQYPVFIRYVNKLMEEDNNILDSLSMDNSLKAIGILVEKLIKWEFRAINKTHAYFSEGKRKGEKKPEYICFEDSINKMIDLILGDMISNYQIKSIVNRDSVVSAYKLVFPNNSNEQVNPLQVAHCLFSWDSKETIFEFHNSILWDYFVSKYIYEPATDYKIRKYMFNYKSEDTRLYQSVITIYFQRLYENLSPKVVKELFHNSEKEKQISINTIAGLCLTEYYKKLPFDDWSFIHSSGAVFKATIISDIIENKILDLYSECMLDINRASDIVELCTDDEIKALTHIAFHELSDDNFDINFLFGLPNLQYVTLPPYHKTFLRLDEYNNSNIRKLHLWHRTPLDKAESRFCNGENTKNDIDLLKIIFQLEIEETEFMGLDKPDYQSTCWTALSLAEAYRDKAFYSTKDEQSGVLDKIVRAINSDWENKSLNYEKLKYRYCYDYGRLYISRGKSARDSGILWLLVPYESISDNIFIRFNRYNLGCELVKAYAWNHDIEKGVSVLNTLEERYGITEADTNFYKLRCALHLSVLKKEYDTPTESAKKMALNALDDFSNSKDKSDSLYGYYASEFYMITGDYENAKLAIDKLGDALSKSTMNGDDDENYQGNWIKYHHMLLLYY